MSDICIDIVTHTMPGLTMDTFLTSCTVLQGDTSNVGGIFGIFKADLQDREQRKGPKRRDDLDTDGTLHTCCCISLIDDSIFSNISSSASTSIKEGNLAILLFTRSPLFAFSPSDHTPASTQRRNAVQVSDFRTVSFNMAFVSNGLRFGPFPVFARCSSSFCRVCRSRRV